MKKKLVAMSLVVSLLSTTAFPGSAISSMNTMDDDALEEVVTPKGYFATAKDNVVDGVTSVKDSVNNGVKKTGGAIKDGTHWVGTKVNNGAQDTYSFVWGNRNKWTRAAEVAAAVVTLGYYFQDALPESVRDALGLEPTEDDCTMYSVR